MVRNMNKTDCMTIDDVIAKLTEAKEKYGNIGVVVRTRDEDIYGYYVKDLRFDYIEKASLVKNMLVL